MIEVVKRDIPDFFLASENSETEYSQEGRWSFLWGDPEFWRYGLLERVGPGTKVLDIGIGQGRSAFPFAMYGADVRGVDISAQNVEWINELAIKSELPNLAAEQLNIQEADLGEGVFDIILIDFAFAHWENASDVVRLLDKALKALKSDGIIYIRGDGEESEDYQELLREADGDHTAVKGNLYDWCDCSGEHQLEPLLHIPQTGLLEWATKRRLHILHSQTIPENGRRNIMYGEDWDDRPESLWEEMLIESKTYGLVTLIAQKP